MAQSHKPAVPEAVVMAAGDGTRMRPLTEHWPKPVLPIDGRAVISTLLRELADAGCRRAAVVTGHLAEQVEGLVGDGRAFGLEVRFARQAAPDGSADAVRCALDAGAEPPLLVLAADTVFTPGDVGRFAHSHASSSAAGALAVRRRETARRSTSPVLVEGGRIAGFSADDPASPFFAAPLWALGPPLEAFLDGLAGPPYELVEAYQRAIDSGLEVAAVEIGSTRDLTFPLDLMIENFPYLGRP